MQDELGEIEATPPGPAAAVRSLIRRVVFLRSGLAGQTLAFAAMLVPILLREGEQVLVLVFASAVTVLLTNAALLAYPFLYPVIRGPRMARVATTWSLISLGVVSAALLLVMPLEPVLDLPRGTFAAAAVLTATLGVYDVVITQLVRAGDLAGIGLARLYYGASVLVLATAACLAPLGPLALTFSTGLAYVVTAGLLTLRRRHGAPRVRRPSAAARRRLRRAYWSRAARPAVASLAGGWTVFLPGLALPGLGAAAEPWAIVSRICGGFMTVLLTLVAPPLEARLAQAIRMRDRLAFVAGRRTALLMSSGVAVVAVVTGLALAVYAAGSPSEWFGPIALATGLFWGLLLAGSTINRLPNFLGRDVARLYWDAGRAGLVTAAYLSTDGVMRLIVMGAILTASGVLLLPMTRWRERNA